MPKNITKDEVMTILKASTTSARVNIPQTWDFIENYLKEGDLLEENYIKKTLDSMYHLTRKRSQVASGVGLAIAKRELIHCCGRVVEDAETIQRAQAIMSYILQLGSECNTDQEHARHSHLLECFSSSIVLSVNYHLELESTGKLTPEEAETNEKVAVQTNNEKNIFYNLALQGFKSVLPQLLESDVYTISKNILCNVRSKYSEKKWFFNKPLIQQKKAEFITHLLTGLEQYAEFNMVFPTIAGLISILKTQWLDLGNEPTGVKSRREALEDGVDFKQSLMCFKTNLTNEMKILLAECYASPLADKALEQESYGM